MFWKFWHKKKKKKELKEEMLKPPSASPETESITHWQREQFLREFNDKERKYFLELVQKSVLGGYPVCLDLYFFCFFSTLKYRFLTQVGYDARFSYVYAWGLKDLNDQISFYQKRLEKLKNS